MKIDSNLYILGGLKEVNEADVVYRYNLDDNSLYKTEYNINLLNSRFCSEKIFQEYEKGKYYLFDVTNNIHQMTFAGGKFEYKLIPYN